MFPNKTFSFIRSSAWALASLVISSSTSQFNGSMCFTRSRSSFAKQYSLRPIYARARRRRSFVFSGCDSYALLRKPIAAPNCFSCISTEERKRKTQKNGYLTNYQGFPPSSHDIPILLFGHPTTCCYIKQTQDSVFVDFQLIFLRTSSDVLNYRESSFVMVAGAFKIMLFVEIIPHPSFPKVLVQSPY